MTKRREDRARKSEVAKVTEIATDEGMADLRNARRRFFARLVL